MAQAPGEPLLPVERMLWLMMRPAFRAVPQGIDGDALSLEGIGAGDAQGGGVPRSEATASGTGRIRLSKARVGGPSRGRHGEETPVPSRPQAGRTAQAWLPRGRGVRTAYFSRRP